MVEYPCDQYVAEALRIATELLDLANDGDAKEHDDGCGILLGVLRDCAYKIRREAERESQSHQLRKQSC